MPKKWIRCEKIVIRFHFFYFNEKKACEKQVWKTTMIYDNKKSTFKKIFVA